VLAEALRWVPDYAPALVARGRVALGRGEPDRAIAWLEQAYRVQPLPETAWLLADARDARRRRRRRGRRRRVVEAGRRSDRLTLALFYATTNRSIDEALRLIEEERAGRGGVYVDDTYAWVLYRAGRYEEARRASDRAMRLGTPDARIIYHAGAIRMAAGVPAGRALVERRWPSTRASMRPAPPRRERCSRRDAVPRSVAVLVLLLLRATPGHAHAVGVSRGEYRVDGARVHADLVFARKELLAALPGLDADRDGELSSAEVAGGRDELAAWLGRGVVVEAGGAPCAGDLAGAMPMEQDGIELTAVHRCAGPADAFSVRLPLLADLSLGHRHLAGATSPSGTVRRVLFAAEPRIDLAAPRAEAGRVVPSLFRLGIEHILTGYDHLLFLIAVVLVGGPLRSILGAVTAFTLAHSVTLAVAALGVWTPRPTLVEPAIALSIAYVGVENCIVHDLRRRWRLTFLFGLVHGFGFAGARREIAVAPAELPLALASFNVGVEAGQLAVLAVVLPWTAWLVGRRWFAAGGLGRRASRSRRSASAGSSFV
jgi:hydrogenase/urease accessory protein HupE/tetratricopeptide (TPR) repeat protein